MSEVRVYLQLLTVEMNEIFMLRSNLSTDTPSKADAALKLSQLRPNRLQTP
jgi:hypothetical protein